MTRRMLLVARGLDAVGTGREVLQTAQRLLERGDDVHLALTTRPAHVAHLAAAAGVTVHRLSPRPQGAAASIAGLYRTVARVQPHLVASWGWSAMRATGMALAPLRRQRRPRWLAVLGRPPRPATATARWTIRRLLTRCDLVLAATQGTLSSCHTLGVPHSQIRHCPPGIAAATVPTLSRQQVAERLGLPLGDTWTLCVAPLMARSRLERLVWAADQLDVVLQGLTHVLIGQGPLGPQLARRARAQEAADRIRILPHCDIVSDLLAQVRLVWQPGEVAYGGALVDALAAGVPTVAVAGDTTIPLIDDTVTGRLVPADPPSEFPRRGLPFLEDEQVFQQFAAASRTHAHEAFPLADAWKIQQQAFEDLL